MKKKLAEKEIQLTFGKNILQRGKFLNGNCHANDSAGLKGWDNIT